MTKFLTATAIAVTLSIAALGATTTSTDARPNIFPTKITNTDLGSGR